MEGQQKTHRGLEQGRRGEAPAPGPRGAESMAANPETESPSVSDRLMEEICEPENLRQALRRVRANKGAPGVDGMTVKELPAYLKSHWAELRGQLLRLAAPAPALFPLEAVEGQPGQVSRTAGPRHWPRPERPNCGEFTRAMATKLQSRPQHGPA